MSEWKRYKLSELYEMSSGISSTKEQAGHGSPFLSFSVVFNNYFLPDSLIDLMDTTDGEKQKYSIKEGDIFLTRTSETVDELAMSSVALKDYPEASFSGFLKRLRPVDKTIVYPKFMAFYLRSPLFRRTIINNTVMTLRASFNEAMFSYLEIMLPDFDTQKKIGDFLYSLEKKKQINNQINQELEAMAKTLYDYWFVQFDFPDQNGKPYKSSGGKMVYHPELKREIPEGWGVTTFSSWISDNKTGDWGKETSEGNYTLEVDCIRGADINGLSGNGKTDMPTRFILEKNKNKLLTDFDIVIEISGGSPTQSTGRIVGISESVLNRFDLPLICSNFCKAVSLKEQETFYNFVYEWKNLYDNGVLFSWEGKTSGIKNLLFDSFVTNYHIAQPPIDLMKQFFDYASSVDKKTQLLLKQNQELTQLRDWLLPMLMNGQVKVER